MTCPPKTATSKTEVSRPRAASTPHPDQALPVGMLPELQCVGMEKVENFDDGLMV